MKSLVHTALRRLALSIIPIASLWLGACQVWLWPKEQTNMLVEFAKAPVHAAEILTFLIIYGISYYLTRPYLKDESVDRKLTEEDISADKPQVPTGIFISPLAIEAELNNVFVSNSAVGVHNSGIGTKMKNVTVIGNYQPKMGDNSQK